MKKLILSVLVVTTLFTSCKKKDDASTSCEISLTGMAGNYKLTAASLTIPGVPAQDITSAAQPCGAAAVYAFNASGAATYSGGTCTTPETGNWSITSGKMTFDVGETGTALTVSSWNCSTFVLTDTQSVGGVSFTYSYTFTKQ